MAHSSLLLSKRNITYTVDADYAYNFKFPDRHTWNKPKEPSEKIMYLFYLMFTKYYMLNIMYIKHSCFPIFSFILCLHTLAFASDHIWSIFQKHLCSVCTSVLDQLLPYQSSLLTSLVLFSIMKFGKVKWLTQHKSQSVFLSELSMDLTNRFSIWPVDFFIFFMWL